MQKQHGRFREKSPHWKGGKHISNGYVKILKTDHPNSDSCGYIHEHILMAEKALGKPLPPKTHIHHYSTKKDNTKIVICQDAAYHQLLHIRSKALNSCGNANYRKCVFCKEYDDPKNLYIKYGLRTKNNKKYSLIHHKSCKRKYSQESYRKKKAI